MAELGIVGEILLLLIVFYLLKDAVISIDNNTAIVISLIVFLIHFGLEIDNLYPVLYAILAILAGFSQTISTKEIVQN